MEREEREDQLTWNALDSAQDRQIVEIASDGLVRFVLELRRARQAEAQPNEPVIAF